MIKKLLSVALVASAICANAQQIVRKTNNNPEILQSSSSLLKQGNNQVSTTCYTLTTATANDTSFLYTVTSGTSCPTGGYLAGNNCYGDLAKATNIPASMVPPASQITGVLAVFYKNGTKGTKGTGTISVDIFAGDTATGPTGTALGTATASLATITSGTVTGISLPYLFNFTLPVNAPATGFFAALNLPTTTGDTAALFVTRNGKPSLDKDYAWEKWSDNSWNSFRPSWGINTTLTLLPIACNNISGVHNNILEASSAIFPNPGNGQFNFAFSLSQTTNITVNVVNTLGQSVFTKIENNVSAAVLSYDLTSLGKGIYFVNISDSQNNKMIRKIVIE